MISNILVKASHILTHHGKVIKTTDMGLVMVYGDSMLRLESNLEGNLNLRIGYSDDGKPAIEIWDGNVITHPGNHITLYRYIDAVYESLEN